MYYSEEIVERVRESNDIVDVIGSYVKLQKKGANFMGLCPFHGEKTASFSVSQGRQMYHCFGCGVGGNVVTFLMNYDNLSFPEAIQSLAERAGIDLPKAEQSSEEKLLSAKRLRLTELYKIAATFYFALLKTPNGERALQYFQDRGLTAETIKHFGLGYSDIGGKELYRYLKGKGFEDELLRESGLFTFDEKKGVYDKFWNRAMFPIMNRESKVIGFGGRVMGEGEPKYLNSPETLIFDKSRNLFALNYARQTRKNFFLLCEGYMDVITLHQAGFTNAVASLGTSLTSLQASLISKYVKSVYITYDSDGAGQKATLRAIPILKSVGISAKVVSLKPYKDPDEFIKALGTEEYEKRIQEAKNSFFFEIDVLKASADMSDPEQKTNFFRETAKKLLQFPEEMERRTYTEAVAREYQIGFDMLNRLVNQYGGVLMREEEQKETKKLENLERKKKKTETGIATSQKLFLTFVAGEPELYKKIKGFISAEDFSDDFYKAVANEIFTQYEKEGKVTPARILNHYETKEEQEKAAELFQTMLNGDLSEEERKKAFSETVRRVKQNGIEMQLFAAAETGDTNAMQQAIQMQSMLSKRMREAGL